VRALENSESTLIRESSFEGKQRTAERHIVVGLMMSLLLSGCYARDVGEARREREREREGVCVSRLLTIRPRIDLLAGRGGGSRLLRENINKGVEEVYESQGPKVERRRKDGKASLSGHNDRQIGILSAPPVVRPSLFE
jgi:hypothetical protein